MKPQEDRVHFEIKLSLPGSLAEAEAGGLLRAEFLEAVLREEIRRRRVDQLFQAADRLAGIGQPLTEAEVEAEIQAARQQRRRAHTRRR